MSHNDQQQRSIAKIRELGGSVGFQSEFNAERGEEASSPTAEENPVDLVFVSDFDGDVESMVTAILSLPNLPAITSFAWVHSNVGDKEVLKILGKLSGLVELILEGTDVSDLVLEYLPNLPNLETAVLLNTLVSKQAKPASGSPNLQIAWSRRPDNLSRTECSEARRTAAEFIAQERNKFN